MGGGNAEGHSLASAANASKLAEDFPIYISQPPCLFVTFIQNGGKKTLSSLSETSAFIEEVGVFGFQVQPWTEELQT